MIIKENFQKTLEKRLKKERFKYIINMNNKTILEKITKSKGSELFAEKHGYGTRTF